MGTHKSLEFFYCFEVVKFPQKRPIFTFGVVKNPHMIGLRPFCAPEFIQLHTGELKLYARACSVKISAERYPQISCVCA